MQKIQRIITNGQGNGQVDTQGMPFAIVTTETFARIAYTVAGVTYECGPGRINLPVGVTKLNITTIGKWEVFLQSVPQAQNQKELKLTITEDGKLLVDGDQDVVVRGQDVDSVTVDISGLRDDLQTLGNLYQDAIFMTETPDAAARYIKMKNAVLLRYAN